MVGSLHYTNTTESASEKNFEDQSTFGKVMGKNKVSCFFFTHGVLFIPRLIYRKTISTMTEGVCRLLCRVIVERYNHADKKQSMRSAIITSFAG